jgi:response regulator RpfG family c-di-GMP phosphodiesterase
MKNAKKSKKTILHVEDDADQRELVSRVIEPKFNYIGIENAEGAALILKEDDVDLIILDLALPLMNGFEFLKSNKEIVEDKKMPVIVTTGLSGANIESLCRSHKCRAYYKKPLELKKLVNRIKELVNV